MPTLYFTAFQRDSAVVAILLLLVIVSAIQSRSKLPIEGSPWHPIIARYWNLVGSALMLLGFLWRLSFHDR